MCSGPRSLGGNCPYKTTRKCARRSIDGFVMYVFISKKQIKNSKSILDEEKSK